MNTDTIKKYLSAVLKDWDKTKNDPFVEITFKTIAHWNIILLIGQSTYTQHKISYESLCQHISHRIASRATIQRIINELITINYVEKNISKTDQRTKYLILTEAGKKEFTKFVSDEIVIFKEILN